MKPAYLLLCLFTAGLAGCTGEPTVTNIATPPKANDESIYCFVGMD